MFEHLRRLATTGAAYTASSVLSKLIAVFLLPVYTAYLSPADYGAAEVMLASLVAASIVVRLGVIEATFDPLPVDAEVAREWGRLSAAVATRGGNPRRRAVDLAIAATANTHRVPLLTHNLRDFRIIDDLVDARSPSARAR